MGTIVVSENVSLDGVVEDPAGDEGFSRGGWVGLLAAREDVAKRTLELRLKVFPVVLGAGERLFGETSQTKPLRLLESETLDGGITFLTYAVDRAS